MDTPKCTPLDEKRAAALTWLGERYVLHPFYGPPPLQHASTWYMLRRTRPVDVSPISLSAILVKAMHVFAAETGGPPTAIELNSRHYRWLVHEAGAYMTAPTPGHAPTLYGCALLIHDQCPRPVLRTAEHSRAL